MSTHYFHGHYIICRRRNFPQYFLYCSIWDKEFTFASFAYGYILQISGKIYSNCIILWGELEKCVVSLFDMVGCVCFSHLTPGVNIYFPRCEYDFFADLSGYRNETSVGKEIFAWNTSIITLPLRNPFSHNIWNLAGQFIAFIIDIIKIYRFCFHPLSFFLLIFLSIEIHVNAYVFDNDVYAPPDHLFEFLPSFGCMFLRAANDMLVIKCDKNIISMKCWF